MDQQTNNVIGTRDLSEWRTMILLKQGLEYMINSGKPKFNKEIEKDKGLLAEHLRACVSKERQNHI